MAKKSLEKMLSDNTERPEANKFARRQAIFLSYWEQIEGAYSKGWSYMDIWKVMTEEGVIDFGYSTFLHYKDKLKRREREVERERERLGVIKAKPEGELAQPRPTPPKTPGSTKVDLPVFGQSGIKREAKRF